MSKRKTVRKPVGTAGITRITKTEQGYSIDFQQAEFPHEKEKIEAEIVQAFVLSARDKLPNLADPAYAQNEQNDFDFNLLLANGEKRHLELKEIAPLQRGGYEAASAHYEVHDFATFIRRMILKQSERYKSSTGSGLFLLLYVTDWRFILSESVINLLRYWTIQDAHCFQRIYVYHVISKEEGISQIVYPEATPAGFDPASVRHNRVTNHDPKKMREMPGGGVGWEIVP